MGSLIWIENSLIYQNYICISISLSVYNYIILHMYIHISICVKDNIRYIIISYMAVCQNLVPL